MITLEDAKNKATEVKLESVTKTTIHIDCFNLEKWFSNVFGKDLEFCATMECNNDSSHDFDVDGDADLCNGKAEEFIYGNAKYPPNYGISSVLNVLCRDGFIPVGEYIINVCW